MLPSLKIYPLKCIVIEATVTVVDPEAQGKNTTTTRETIKDASDI
jgi:hypothetical protein